LQKYLGIYTLFYEKEILSEETIIDKHTNKKNVYLKGRFKTEIHRYDKNNIAIYFPSNQTVNNIIPILESKNVKLTLVQQSDTENIYIANEKFIDILHEELKFMIKNKNEQLKQSKLKNKIPKK